MLDIEKVWLFLLQMLNLLFALFRKIAYFVVTRMGNMITTTP